ncbi:MAG: hypothetical protein EON87_04600, partial [Brevundimonas sp.]
MTHCFGGRHDTRWKLSPHDHPLRHAPVWHPLQQGAAALPAGAGSGHRDLCAVAADPHQRQHQLHRRRPDAGLHRHGHSLSVRAAEQRRLRGTAPGSVGPSVLDDVDFPQSGGQRRHIARSDLPRPAPAVPPVPDDRGSQPAQPRLPGAYGAHGGGGDVPAEDRAAQRSEGGRRRVNKALIVFALPLALVACKTVGPDYEPPSVATPAAFAELGEGAVGTPADLSRWWSRFGDAELDSLISRALAQSLDLQTAAARLREARSQIAVARSALLPTVSGSAVTVQRDAPFANSAAASSGSGSGGGSPLAALPDRLSLYSLGVDATWELDLFGGARRGVEAATAQAEAAEWQARDVQVALSGAVAKAYFNLRSAQARKV